MAAQESVTNWIASLRSQDDQAAARLFGRYIERLKALARQKLAPRFRRTCDEEDIALVALQEVFQGIQDGRFHRLNDRDDLWQVLVMLVDRRVTDQIRRVTARKRGEGRERGESAFERHDRSSSQLGGITQVVGNEPTPEFAVEFVEEFNRRIAALHDPGLREIALRKLEGYSNAEIAQQRGCTQRTIQRKLTLIRKTWDGE